MVAENRDTVLTRSESVVLKNRTFPVLVPVVRPPSKAVGHVGQFVGLIHHERTFFEKILARTLKTPPRLVASRNRPSGTISFTEAPDRPLHSRFPGFRGETRALYGRRAVGRGRHYGALDSGVRRIKPRKPGSGHCLHRDSGYTPTLEISWFPGGTRAIYERRSVGRGRHYASLDSGKEDQVAEALTSSFLSHGASGCPSPLVISGYHTR